MNQQTIKLTDYVAAVAFNATGYSLTFHADRPELTFEPMSETRYMQVARIYVGDIEVGQERVSYGKPFKLVDGKLVPNEPVYRYIRFDLAVDTTDEPVAAYAIVPCDNPLVVVEDEDERSWIAPAWSTIEAFEQSLIDFPLNVVTE
jgi:hypothetical protein